MGIHIEEWFGRCLAIIPIRNQINNTSITLHVFPFNVRIFVEDLDTILQLPELCF